MAKHQLPSPEVLRQLLRYEPETGKLFWKLLLALCLSMLLSIVAAIAYMRSALPSDCEAATAFMSSSPKVLATIGRRASQSASLKSRASASRNACT